MISSSSFILFGVIVLIAVVVIWKWWKKAPSQQSTDSVTLPGEVNPLIEVPDNPPPMVFAVNDAGNLDLTDVSGKLLNIGFGSHPKTYIILLDQAEKDTEKIETDDGIQFKSKVGNTKSYEVIGHPFIINYTRL